MIIRTPDYRLHVFVSSTLKELAEERGSVREAILNLRLAPVMFESGARPHPPQELYKSYISQSQIFIGIYWQSYGWIAPGMPISGLEDEYNLSARLPRLIYIKNPAPGRAPALAGLLERIKNDNSSCYSSFSTPQELKELVQDDLALLLTEHFETKNDQPPGEIKKNPPSNLPIPRNSLIGRVQDLQNAHDLILQKEVALVTLTGPGGTGKSRLGIQIALELREHFRDGVFIVGLESILDAHFVIPAIAETLGIRATTGGQPIMGKLKEYLADKQILLFLDNFEHILSAAPQIAELLEACWQLKILATSRAPLHLRCEKEFPVLPLPVPQAGSVDDLQSLSQNSAVKLFIERGQAIKSTFQLTNENAPVVAEICRHLDGLPLAIELAAARLRIMSPRTLLERLSKSFDVLNGGMQDLPDRQRTLHRAIDWSYCLLTEPEKRLFRRLSVFLDGWTLEAAEMICSLDGEQPQDILDGLERFIDNSLINPPVEVEGEPRFTMLETIREYSCYRLSESGESSRIRTNYHQYYLRFAEQAESELKGPGQLEWIKRVEAEHENLQIALEYSLPSQDVQVQAGTDHPGAITAMRLSAALYLFWFILGYWDEGQEWLRKALTVSAQAPPQIHAKVLSVAGLLAFHQGNTARACSLLNESMEMSREHGDKSNLAYALLSLGIVGFWNESSSTARAMEAESATLFEELADKWGLACARFSQGQTASWQGDYMAATTFMEQSVSLFLELGDRWHAGEPIRHLGYLAMREGDHIKADGFYRESLEISREIGDRPGLASALISLGDVALIRGDYQPAITYYQDSLEILIKLDDKLGIAHAKHGLSKAAAAQGDYAAAGNLVNESIAILRAMGDKGGAAWMIQDYGHMMICWNSESRDGLPGQQFLEPDQNLIRLLCEGLTLARELGHIITIAFCILGLAGLVGLAGQPERAARLWGAAEVLRLEGQGFMSTLDKHDYGKDEDVIRNIVDQDLYRSDYDKGRGMTPQQAENYALEEKDRF